MISRGKNRNPGIQYEYTLAKNLSADPQPQFEWRMADWTPCSVTCGGGIQYQFATCIDVNTQVETPPPWPCMGEDQPDDESRECNAEPCPSHWWVGPWQACPVTCTRKVSSFVNFNRLTRLPSLKFLMFFLGRFT